MQHNSRYLKGSEENEPNITWNKQMHELVREMLHYRNSLGEQDNLDPVTVAGLEERYDAILESAKKKTCPIISH